MSRMEAEATGLLLVTLINDGEADDLMVFPLVEDQDLIRRWADLKGYRDTDLCIRPTSLNSAAELFADEMQKRTR